MSFLPRSSARPGAAGCQAWELRAARPPSPPAAPTQTCVLQQRWSPPDAPAAPQLGTRLPEQVTALLTWGARDHLRLPFCPHKHACYAEGPSHLTPPSPPLTGLVSFPHQALVPAEPRPGRGGGQGAETCSLGTGADCFSCPGRRPWVQNSSGSGKASGAPVSPPLRPGKGVRLTQQEGPQGLTSPRRRTRPQTPACRWGVCLSLLPGPHPLQGAGSLLD